MRNFNDPDAEYLELDLQALSEVLLEGTSRERVLGAILQNVKLHGSVFAKTQIAKQAKASMTVVNSIFHNLIKAELLKVHGHGLYIPHPGLLITPLTLDDENNVARKYYPEVFTDDPDEN